jgi:hypothetical protein
MGPVSAAIETPVPDLVVPQSPLIHWTKVSIGSQAIGSQAIGGGYLRLGKPPPTRRHADSRPLPRDFEASPRPDEIQSSKAGLGTPRHLNG